MCLVSPRSLKSLGAAQDTPGCRRGCSLGLFQGGNPSVSHNPAVGPVPMLGVPSGLCQAWSYLPTGGAGLSMGMWSPWEPLTPINLRLHPVLAVGTGLLCQGQ